MRVLVELESKDVDVAGLRRFLKTLARRYSITCTAVRRVHAQLSQQCPDAAGIVSSTIPHTLDVALNRALETVQRARQEQRRRRPTLDSIDAAEAALLEVLGVLHGQQPARARQAAAVAVQAARYRDGLAEGSGVVSLERDLSEANTD